MGVDFAVDSPASVGDVSSWSVSEAATQGSPVDSVRATPSFGVVVKSTVGTKFATQEAATLTHELGAIEGYVRSVNPVGVRASLDCQTVLNQLNVDAEFSDTFFPTGLLSEYVAGVVDHAVTNPPVPPPDPTAGEVWTAGTIPAGVWYGLAFGNGLFVTATQTGTQATATSPDGVTWTIGPGTGMNATVSIAFGNGVFVAVGSSGGNVSVSPDGVTWTPIAGVAGGTQMAVSFGGGVFVSVANSGTISYSTDGSTWSSTTPFGSLYWDAVAYGNGVFVAVARSGGTGTQRVATSPDGITWTLQTTPTSNAWYAVAYGDGLFVVSNNQSSDILTSTDGVSWVSTTGASKLGSPIRFMTYGNGLFVLGSSASGFHVATSPDGITWTTRIADGVLNGVFALGMFVVVGTDYVATSGTFSPPFTHWDSSNDPTDTYIPWRGNIWQMLNNLLMLNNVELVFADNKLTIRDIGSVVMEIDDSTIVNRQITAVDARQSVNVAYREAYEQTGTIYDAYTDGNKVYTIGVNEYRLDKIVYEIPLKKWDSTLGKMVQYGTITNVPTELDQPFEAPLLTSIPEPGQWIISDSDGNRVGPGDFIGFGGRILVEKNEDDPFSFWLRWNGPVSEIPNHPGPYSFLAGQTGSPAFGDTPASDDYRPSYRGCFSVTGTATFAVDKTVNVRTGADPEIVTDATPLELTIPFVNSKTQAFHVGAAAGADLSSTTEVLSFDIATNKLEGFGLTPGSLFRWQNAYWRMVEVTIRGATTSITARYHTTFDQVDTEWTGQTYAAFDAAWSGHKYKDFRIEPLKTSANLPHIYPATTLFPATAVYPS